MDEARDPWTVLAEREIYENPWIRVLHREVLDPNGRPGIYGLVRFRKLAVGVLPLDAEGAVHLVGQWRVPLARYSWEIPEGGAERGEPPEAGARRELAEETGYSCGRLIEAVRLDLSNSVTDEEAIGYLALDLIPGAPAPDSTEALARRRIAFAGLIGEIRSGRIRDAITVATALSVHYMAQTGALDPETARLVLAPAGR